MTPMLRQYTGIKGQYPDAILFFRMGDFYEMFFDDALTASRVLGITLTNRGTWQGEKVPMCGVPHHAVRGYIARLVQSGFKVAVCDQMEDPRLAKGIVKREVVRLVTPGSILDQEDLERSANLFMAALSAEEGVYGLAYADLSTGEFRVTESGSPREIMDELARIAPAEVLVPEGTPEPDGTLRSRYRIETLRAESLEPSGAAGLLKAQFGVCSLDGFGCEGLRAGLTAAGALVYYLREIHKGYPEHIKELVRYHLGDYMFLDEATVAHLELLKTMRRQSEKGSLFQILDRTVTPMGSRLLRRWIAYPLIRPESIRERLSAVGFFREAPFDRSVVRERLERMYDVERLNGRVAMGRANARDLVSLKLSLDLIPALKARLQGAACEKVAQMADALDALEEVAALIGEAIHEEPPAGLKEGGIIREGYHAELDRLISMARDGKGWIARFAAGEQERTGIANLKVGFNRVFGYYIEISKANLHLVPDDYIRKQTLANGERYVTQELKEMEERVLGAEERRITLELELFEEVRARVASHNQRIKATAALIAELDALAGLAEAAEKYHYCCPVIHEGRSIEITEGRHPVIEQTVREEDFVPNDILMDDESRQILIITGPNMAGKSTILRQTALTVLMAQMGSFVPAEKAVIGLVDRIFTRVGASDDLARGQSTFMVEMTETANILRHATPRSLVVLDEIGRGTSTYDGLSIAWAVAEALHDRDGQGVRTLFATHYHELTDLCATKPRARNLTIAVREWNDRIIFLRKLAPGGASRSYGIQVARIAGLPESVLERAKEILENLEGRELDEIGRPQIARSKSRRQDENRAAQLHLFPHHDAQLSDWIRKLDLSSMTPLEALLELNKLQEFIDKP